ncbi:MAG: hypothetical protein GX795_05355 [Firmicutes bacterium]|nr:hypothetical protein [Bacillota bacterium]
MGKRQRKRSRKKRQRRSIQYRGFFAYPDANKSQGEISRAAIERLNCDPNCDFDLLDWKDTTGSRIISNILQAISERHFLVADISGLNPNVLFEVGFACGSKKHLVLVGQGKSTEERQRDLANMHILSGINVFPYQNAEDLATCIIKEAREFHKEPTTDKYIISGTGQVTPKGVLFLKGSTNHEYARAALDELKNRFDTVAIDDWNEDISQPLSWYLSQMEERSAVAACFVDQTWDNAVRVNARFAVICGIAVAMRKPVLMVGLPGYKPHFDYQDLLKIPRKLGYVKQIVNQSADNHDKKAQSTSLYHLAPGLSPANIRKSTKLGKDEKELVLLDLVVGSGFISESSNTIAENEEAFLPNYFVETGQFRRLMSTSQALVIGTKGSGKTANLFMLREKLSTDRRNIVRVVKPSDHEMSRFFSGLKKIGDPSGRATHVAENAWKLLLYCEILSSLHGLLVHNRVPASLSDAERDLLDFCESRAELLQASFAQRLDIVADWLLETEYDSDNFSQLVHQRFMNEASSRLSGSVLRGKTIVIMVDNLDKTWGPGPDTQESLIMPLSLLGLQRKIGHELGKNINVNLIAFLRRNMFELILDDAREPDKLLSDAVELVWDEPRTLLKVIDERLKASSATHIGHEVDPWTTFFPPTVEGVPTQQWIMESNVPRPRDLIHLVRRAI